MKKLTLFLLWLVWTGSVFGQCSNSVSPCDFLDHTDEDTLFCLAEMPTMVGNFQVTNKTITTSSDAEDVNRLGLIFANTGSGTITLGGLSNGVAGQVVLIVKINTTNNLVIEHNEGTGFQKFYTPSAGDITLGDYGGFWAVFSGTFWYVLALP